MNDRRLRIAHICLASSYTEGMTYQDNILPAQNRKDGHEVLIVSDCTQYVNGKLASVPPEDKILPDGTRLVRLSFAGRLLPKYVRGKLRSAPQLRALLDTFRPDVILYHGVIGTELLTVGSYKSKNPATRLYLDSHEDFNNSGRTIASRLLQYRLLTRFFWTRISRQVDKVFYVSYESREFLRTLLGIPDDRMEFFPLGGYVREPVEKMRIRQRVRTNLELHEDEVVFIHAGKLDRAKRTVETLRAFAAEPDPLYRLLIVGAIGKEIEKEVMALIAADTRVRFLGWKTGEELLDLLSASDCYLQPGTQSATLQVALCCGLPVAIYPYPSHAPYLNGNGFFVQSAEEIRASLSKFRSAEARHQMSCLSLEIGRKLLDYRALARRLYQ